jgi:predicted GIY-YIG superfamily endonuclease
MLKPILIKPILYILKLKDDKYYIGITLNLNQRLAQHFSGEGSQFTKKYKPLEVLKVIYNNDINEEYENNLTLEYMEKYGWENVRGGYYTRLVIKKPNQIK